MQIRAANIIVKDNAFAKLGVAVSRATLCVDVTLEGIDIHVLGALSGESLTDAFVVQAMFCTKDGSILYVGCEDSKQYHNMEFGEEIFDISVFNCDLEDLDHIEILPKRVTF